MGLFNDVAKKVGTVAGEAGTKAKDLANITKLSASVGAKEKEIEKLGIDEEIKKYFRFCLAIKLCEQPDTIFSHEEAKNIFIKIERELAHSFKVPARYFFVNFRTVTRRFLGMCKRSLKYRKIPRRGHLNRLIASIEKESEITQTEKCDNLVINGYPLPE